MRASLTIRHVEVLILALTMGGLAACGSDMDDLDEYINTIKARPGGRIEPLPEITPYEGFTYIADVQGLRSPFRPDTPQASALQVVPVPTANAVASTSRAIHWTRLAWSARTHRRYDVRLGTNSRRFDSPRRSRQLFGAKRWTNYANF